MSIFKKKINYYDIGKDGSADKFFEGFLKALSSDSAQANAGTLVDGAVQALREGRPDNIQTAFLNERTLKNSQSHTYPSVYILLKLTEGSHDKPAAVKLALEKLPEDEREDLLNNALYYAVNHNIGGERFFSLLLESGAKANAKIDGHAGSILVTAMMRQSPLSVIKLLHDKGASFDDALTAMEIRGYNKTFAKKLEFYREKVEGKPAVTEGQLAAAEAIHAATEEALPTLIGVMQQMMEQVADLTERVGGLYQQVGDLTEEVRSLKSPEETKAAKPTPTRLPLRQRPSA
jgi:hypothetical protein